MDDMQSGHGFITCYNDSNVEHICSDLRRNTKFKFRLQAINEEGESPWSDSVVYSTLPDVPGPPVRPASKGRIHPTSFKVRWDPPADNGGSTITGFLLELAEGQNGWRTVYQGLSCECVCENLQPGTQYIVRVACTSSGGVSQYSEVCNISTEPVVPDQCAPPRVHGKPKANSLHLKWGWPEMDGGSPVTEFEIDMTSPDNQTRAVYRGQDTECVVASLLPGRPYLFQVRAHNRAGAGPWSESLEVVSGAGSPDQPKEPKVVCRSGSLALITWEPPINNGALIQEYQLQMLLVRRTVVQYQRQPSNPSAEDEDKYDEDDDESAISSDEDPDEDEEQTEDELSVSWKTVLRLVIRIDNEVFFLRVRKLRKMKSYEAKSRKYPKTSHLVYGIKSRRKMLISKTAKKKLSSLKKSSKALIIKPSTLALLFNMRPKAWNRPASTISECVPWTRPVLLFGRTTLRYIIINLNLRIPIIKTIIVIYPKYRFGHLQPRPQWWVPSDSCLPRQNPCHWLGLGLLAMENPLSTIMWTRGPLCCPLLGPTPNSFWISWNRTLPTTSGFK